MNKIYPFILCAAVLLILGLGLQKYSRSLERDAEVTGLRRRLAALELQGNSVQREVSAAERVRDEAAKTIRDREESKRAPAAEVKPARRDPRTDAQAFLLANPDQKAALIEVGRAQIRRTYTIFYRQATLTPDQIEKFENIVAQSWADNAMLTANGIFPDPRHVPNDQLVAVVGPAGFQLYQDYQRALPAYNLVAQLATATTSADVPPLSPDQSGALAKVIRENNASYQNGQSLQIRPENLGALSGLAAKVLLPEQLKVFTAMIDGRQYRIALDEALQSESHNPAH